MTFPLAIIIGSLLVATGLGSAAYFLRAKSLPVWPPRDWRALLALTASIGGAAILTLAAVWLIWLLDAHAVRLISELVRDKAARPEVGQVLVMIVKTLAWGLKLLLAGVIAVLLSLGLAINKRNVSLTKSGFQMSGGDDDAARAAEETARAASDKADEIREETQS